MPNDSKSILKIVSDFKANKWSTSKIESDLEISNGLLGKAAKGTTKLSDEKFKKLEAYYVKHFITAINPLKVAKENLGDLSDKVTTANNIEAVERNQKEALDEFDEDREQGKRLRLFAKQNKTDCDTIFSWLMDNYGKVLKTPPVDPKQGNEKIFKDFTQDKSYGKPYNPFDNPIYNAKMSNKRHQQ